MTQEITRKASIDRQKQKVSIHENKAENEMNSEFFKSLST